MALSIHQFILFFVCIPQNNLFEWKSDYILLLQKLPTSFRVKVQKMSVQGCNWLGLLLWTPLLSLPSVLFFEQARYPLPLGLCSSCFLRLDCASPDIYLVNSFTSSVFLLESYFSNEAYHDHSNTASCTPYPIATLLHSSTFSFNTYAI